MAEQPCMALHRQHSSAQQALYKYRQHTKLMALYERVLLCHSVTMSQCDYVTVLLCHSVTMSQCDYAVADLTGAKCKRIAFACFRVQIDCCHRQCYNYIIIIIFSCSDNTVNDAQQKAT